MANTETGLKQQISTSRYCDESFINLTTGQTKSGWKVFCHTSIARQVYCNRGNYSMDHAFSKSFPSAKTLVEENQPFIIFFVLKSPTFWFWQNFVSVFKKALRQSVSTYHKDKWFPTSGCSPIHFRFAASSQVGHTTQITQDTLCVVKMADKGEWKFTRNNELQGKRLQKNLRFGEASCWLPNRGKILVDSSCSLRWSSACS